MDPASSYTFRSMKSALSFLETGEVPENNAFIQKTSVQDLYSFEISTDMVIVLLVFCLSSETQHEYFSQLLAFWTISCKKCSEFCSLTTRFTHNCLS